MTQHKNRIRDVFTFMRPYRGRMIGLMLLTFVLSVLAMLPPLIVRAIIDRVITPGDATLLVPLATMLFAVPILTALSRHIQTIGVAYVGQHFVFDLRNTLYRHLLRLSMRFHGKNSPGMLVNRLMGDSTTIQSVITSNSISIVSEVIAAVFALSATMLINWRLSLLLYIVVSIFILNYRLNIVSIRQANRRYHFSLDRVSAGVQNRLGASLAIKTFGAEEREQNIFQEQQNAMLDQYTEVMDNNVRFGNNMQWLADIGRTLIYFTACAMFLRGDLSYGDVLAFTTYAAQLLWPAVRFSQLARQIQEMGVAADRMFELFDELPEVTEAAKPVKVKRLQGRVDFENISFHYEQGVPVIRDFNLHVQPGQTVALIGQTGCGKTTILSLLLRFFDVTGGSIRMDGHDIRSISLEDLRRQFGIVLQEPLLFQISLAENIRYGNSACDRAAIERAARLAEIHDTIMALPDGYDSVVGNEGIQLSVGERQRITIARAIAADPAILIMDEATSALDSESELAIQTAMARVLAGRTSFIVAHRLSTIRNADMILLLDGGRIIEQGNHNELISRQGRYTKLYEQFMGKGSIQEDEM